jgi:hypothetical protein
MRSRRLKAARESGHMRTIYQMPPPSQTSCPRRRCPMVLCANQAYVIIREMSRRRGRRRGSLGAAGPDGGRAARDGYSAVKPASLAALAALQDCTRSTRAPPVTLLRPGSVSRHATASRNRIRTICLVMRSLYSAAVGSRPPCARKFRKDRKPWAHSRVVASAHAASDRRDTSGPARISMAPSKGSRC